MDFREETPRKAKAVKGAGKRKPQSRTTMDPIARQKSLQHIAAQEADFDDSPWDDFDADMEPIENGSPRPAKRTIKARAKEKTVQKSASLVELTDEDEPSHETSKEYRCREGLMQLRESVR